jgi:hypothetical protein
VCCNIFKGNAAALEISKVPKVKPRRRHINVLYHHLRAEVQNNCVKIHLIKTDEKVSGGFSVCASLICHIGVVIPASDYLSFREMLEYCSRVFYHIYSIYFTPKQQIGKYSSMNIILTLMIIHYRDTPNMMLANNC